MQTESVETESAVKEIPDYKLAAKEFAAAIAPLNLKIECTPVDAKTAGRNPKEWKEARHYHCVILGLPHSVTLESFYSCGSVVGLPETRSAAIKAWLGGMTRGIGIRSGPASGDDVWNAIQSARRGGGLTIFHDEILKLFREKYRPPLTDVLSSIMRDATDPAETFEDWASNYGYDIDSRSAFATWETCCGFYRQLIRAFGRDELTRLQEIINRF